MKEKDEITAAILEGLASGKIPRDVPDECAYSAELTRIAEHQRRIQRAALALGNGDLSVDLEGVEGTLAESLRMLQGSMRRIVSQSRQAVAGDFSQRVDFMGEFSNAFNTMIDRLKEAREELLHIGNHDTLTGLYNRGFFDAEFDRMSRGRAFPISFIVADINGLKLANDRRGNAVGDELIARVGNLLRSHVRGDDILARIGGDEFVIILPTADAAVAEMIIARIRAAIVKENADSDLLPISLSLGSGTAPTAQRMADAYKEADDRMTLDKAAHYLK
jgi:diguanylate cyclase (GGDEF)-like protein